MKYFIQKTTHFGLSLFLLVVLVAGALSLSSTQIAKAWGPVITVDDFDTGAFILTGPHGDTSVSAAGAVGGVRDAFIQDEPITTTPSVMSLVAGNGYLNLALGDLPGVFMFGWGNGLFSSPLNLDVSNHDRFVVTLSQAPSGGDINILLFSANNTSVPSVASQPLSGAGDYTFLFSGFSAGLDSSDIDGIRLYFSQGLPGNSTIRIDSVVIRSELCPAGQYDDGFGCVDAPAGYYVPTPGATSAIPCPVGMFQPLSGATSCNPADPGHYVDTIGSATQTACAVGTFQPLFGATGCDPSQPGYYVDAIGSTAQTECALGTYQPGYGSISCIMADPGYYVDTTGATAQIMCQAGYTSEAGATSCYPSNMPPTANAGGAYSGNEGSAIAMNDATASDPDLDMLTYAWTVNSALCSFNDASALNPNLNCSDNGTYTATLFVDDGVNPAVTSDASVTVNNVAPTLGVISVDAELVPVNTTINASADFTDPGTNDTHTATWDWGDGASSAGTVTQGAGSGSVNDSHSYSAPGVYTVKLTTTDNDGDASNEAIYQFVVVYDPSAGFVTGGGWIDSPAGAYAADTSLSGKATFGFVSKYKKGANVPDGNTEFQFKAGDLNFKSVSYEWLVVAGNKAQFKGEGTINGQGSYQFMINADDDNPDTFRIQIWGDNGIVYDNGSQQSLGGGNIVVHKGK